MIDQIIIENDNISQIISWLKNKNIKDFLVSGKNSYLTSGSKDYLLHY